MRHLLKQRPRGFALVIAIGVLAILIVLGVASAGMSDFTLAFSQARIGDRKLGSALEQGATLLMHKLRVGALENPATNEPIALIQPSGSGQDDISVTATLNIVSDRLVRDDSVLVSREGDTVVLIEASRSQPGAVLRRSWYLVNTAGNRRIPILLQEARK